MCDEASFGEDFVPAHMVKMVMSVQHRLYARASPCDLSRHVHSHLRKGHGIDHKSAILLDHKSGIRDAHLPLPMHDSADSLRNLLHFLLWPIAHTLSACFTAVTC